MRRGATWKARIENFLHGDSQSNYQSEQAKIAIARGFPMGVGPGNSTQRNFLPQAASDFIYAIIIEEYGTVMGLVLLFLYLVLFFRGIRILRHAEKTFGGLLAVGLSFSLVFQAMINMAVAVNLFPVTGQPLPLVSMGGTSIWFTSIAIGIILSVSREVYDREEKEEVEQDTKLATT
jgi:cell division protein FtsW